MVKKLKELWKLFDKQMNDIETTVIAGIERARKKESRILFAGRATSNCSGEEDLGVESQASVSDQTKAAQKDWINLKSSNAKKSDQTKVNGSSQASLVSDFE